MSIARTIAGSRIFCYINGTPFAQVTGFSFTSTNDKKEIRGIDIQTALEFAPTTVSVKGNLKLIRTLGDGGAQSAGILASQVNASREKYFTILLVERSTDLPIFQCSLCSATSENWSVESARGLLVGSIDFSGVLFTNEADL